MRKIPVRVALLLMALGLFLAASPGSAQDPLVTESYVLQQLEQEREARQALEERVASLERQLQQSGLNLQGQTTPVVTEPELVRPLRATEPTVVSLHPGEAIYAAAETELILHSGDVVAIAPAAGGLADLTKGADLRHGEYVGLNHLLLAPRDDGRGVEALTEAVLLVRGEIRYRTEATQG